MNRNAVQDIANGLTYDLGEAVAALSRADAPLGRLMERAGPCLLEARAPYDPFRALMRSIVYQQLSGKAAGTIYGRVLDLLPESTHPEPEQVLALPDEAFRGAGMSRAKVAAIKDLAEKTLEGDVPPGPRLNGMPDDEIIKRFTRVRGVGEWTVQMMLIFDLGRADVLPVKDLGVRKGYMLTYGSGWLPDPADLLEHGEIWRPYRSVASWYLWRAVELYG
jgi:DNA-3-methyladenine glycosylase II